MLSLVFRYEKYLVYSTILSSSKIGIVTILHERMHQLERFRGFLVVNSMVYSQPGNAKQ